jgi:hypothetical protein
MSPKEHLEFLPYLEEVVQQIKSSKDQVKVAQHNMGLVLETLSHRQQLAVTALQ